jgi:cell division protein FtsW
VFACIGLGLMLAVSLCRPATIRRVSVIGFGFGLVSLLLLPVLGTDFGKGAVRWYSLGFFALQPSEFVKPCFVGFTAWLMAGSLERGGPPGKLLSFLIAGAVAFLLASQPDFGQATLVLAVWGVMYFVAGASVPLIAALFAAIATAGVVAYQSSSHFAGRIDGYLAAEVDPRTQLGYAADAIREGGFFGVGVGEGSVKNTLPDAHTDFIIAVAAEEYGLVLCLLVIGLFLFLTLRALWRLTAERDGFTRLAGAGLAALFGLQAFVNLGVATRLLPAKGMTLPFISYGGSSMLAAGIAMGALLALTRRRPQTDMIDAMEAGR